MNYDALTYSQYRNTEYWFNKTEEIKRKRGARCAICQRSESMLPRGSSLELHHIDKVYHRGKEADDDLQLLCGECHSKLHEHQVSNFDEGMYQFEVDSVDERTSQKGQMTKTVNLIVFVGDEKRRVTEWFPDSFPDKQLYFLDSVGLHDKHFRIEDSVGRRGKAFFIQKQDDTGRTWNNVKKWIYKE
jgi:hypothetical protein